MTYLLYLLSSILYVFAFPSFNVSIFAWVCLVPLICAIDREKNIRNVIRNCIITGMIVFMAGMYWLVNVSVIGLVVLSFCLSLFFAAFGVIRFYDKRLLTVPLAWTVLEYARSHVFGGLPWLLLGASQYSYLSLIQISNITGVYGVSFIAALINSAIAKKKRSCILWSLLVLTGVIFYGNYNLNKTINGEKIKIGLIQPNVPMDKKFDPEYTGWMLNKLEDLTRSVDSASVIVWPETSVPAITDRRAIKTKVTLLAEELETNLIVGSQGSKTTDNEKQFFNSAFYVSGKGEIEGEYDKIHLVVFGEYVPLEKHLPFLKWFTPVKLGFAKGSEYKVFKIKDLNNNIIADLAVVICFEDVFPDLVRKFVLNGANILVNITNDAWFGETSSVYQHAYASVFRAVENCKPLVRATNTGLTCFIDHTGRISELPAFEEGAETREMLMPDRTTFYTKYGDIFLWLCIVFLLLRLVIRRKCKN